MDANDPQIDRFRGWSLAALYGALAGFSALLVFATYKLGQAVPEASMLVWLVVIAGSVTTGLSARTCYHFIRTLRVENRAPRLALTPFLAMAITLLAASNLFTKI